MKKRSSKSTEYEPVEPDKLETSTNHDSNNNSDTVNAKLNETNNQNLNDPAIIKIVKSTKNKSDITNLEDIDYNEEEPPSIKNLIDNFGNENESIDDIEEEEFKSSKKQRERLNINLLSEEELYFNIHIWAVRKLLITKYKHNAKLWSKSFLHYTNMVKNNPSQRHDHWIYFKRLRKLIYHQTSSILQNGYYITNKKKIFLNENKSFEKSIKYSKCYKDSRKLIDYNSMNNNNNNIATSIEVLNIDCIDAAQMLLTNGYNPVVLNCGGSRHPGGGWKDGAGAHEENIFRRTSYSVCLNENINNDLYPISKYGCIYSPNIVVFRGNEINDGYKLLENPFEISFIIGCMIRNPKYNNNMNKINNIICDKIKSIFRVSLYHKHDSIVLTAWGCGDFGNKPKHIAQIFKQIINEKEFKNRFKKIIFAILNDHNSGKTHNPQGNLKPFLNVFALQNNVLSVSIANQ